MIKACQVPGEHEGGQITQPRMGGLGFLKGGKCAWGDVPGRGNRGVFGIGGLSGEWQVM